MQHLSREAFAKHPLALRVVFLSIVLLLVSCAAPPAQTEMDSPEGIDDSYVRIMPLGDSTTEGFCDTKSTCYSTEFKRPTGNSGLDACAWSQNPLNPKAVGYRAFLRDKLSAAGIRATFVGSVSVVEGLAHEGHSGFLIRDLDYCIQNAEWLEQAKPDVILLHTGTNDAGWAHKPDEMIADLRLLLEHIYAHLPESTHVIVAQVMPVRSDVRKGYVVLPEPGNDTLAEYNALIPDVILEFQDLGYKISYVDMWGVVQSDAEFDSFGINPRVPVYERMAEVWFAQIVEILEHSR